MYFLHIEVLLWLSMFSSLFYFLVHFLIWVRELFLLNILWMSLSSAFLSAGEVQSDFAWLLRILMQLILVVA